MTSIEFSGVRHKTHKHILATAYALFGHKPFRACELMNHLDSSIFDLWMLEAIRNGSGWLLRDGKKWRLAKRPVRNAK